MDSNPDVCVCVCVVNYFDLCSTNVYTFFRIQFVILDKCLIHYYYYYYYYYYYLCSCYLLEYLICNNNYNINTYITISITIISVYPSIFIYTYLAIIYDVYTVKTIL